MDIVMVCPFIGQLVNKIGIAMESENDRPILREQPIEKLIAMAMGMMFF
jgi:hypothetical protein